MSNVKVDKLPAQLAANTIYIVKDTAVTATDASGQVVINLQSAYYAHNYAGVSSMDQLMKLLATDLSPVVRVIVADGSIQLPKSTESAPSPSPVTPPVAPKPSDTVTVTPGVLSRVVAYFGDSTNAHLGHAAGQLADKENADYRVVNNAQGGSLAAYALMSMDGSPCFLTFNVDQLPAKAPGAMVDAVLSFGKDVVPFSMHSTVCVIDKGDGTLIEMSIVGQNTNVKIYPRESKAFPLEKGKAYPIYLKNHGSVDSVCVIATAKNDINSANIGSWQETLERIKMYTTKCVEQVQPKSKPRFILCTNWGDSLNEGYNPETAAFRVNLKDQYNTWLKTTYPQNTVDIEAYILGEQVWKDCNVTPTQDDLNMQKTKRLPKSLSSDGGAHLKENVRTEVVKLINKRIKELGYL